MAEIQQKINAIQAKIKAIDEKMKSLLVQKKELERQAKEIEENEILSIVRTNGANVQTLNDDLALAKILRENNLTKQDIMELVSPNTKNGGIENE